MEGREDLRRKIGNVMYRARFTRNMGKFESLQIELGLEDEPRGDETHAQAMQRVKEFVESRLFESVDEVELQINTVRDEAVEDVKRWRASQKGK